MIFHSLRLFSLLYNAFLYRNINGLSPLDMAGGHSELIEALHTEVQGVITPLTVQVCGGVFC